MGRSAPGHRHVVLQSTGPGATGRRVSLSRQGNRRPPADVRLGRHPLRLVLQPLLGRAGHAADYALVQEQSPGFQFGYNSFAWADYKAGRELDDMIGDGGMIMAEGIRIERTAT